VGDYGFLTAHRYDGELYPATLDVKNCVRLVTLRKDGITGEIFAARFSD
jgi:hypothetical protein